MEHVLDVVLCKCPHGSETGQNEEAREDEPGEDGVAAQFVEDASQCEGRDSRNAGVSSRRLLVDKEQGDQHRCQQDHSHHKESRSGLSVAE